MKQRKNPPRVALDWLGDPSPNPGPSAAFRLGVPYLVVDQNGNTHVVRDAEALAFTDRKD